MNPFMAPYMGSPFPGVTPAQYGAPQAPPAPGQDEPRFDIIPGPAQGQGSTGIGKERFSPGYPGSPTRMMGANPGPWSMPSFGFLGGAKNMLSGNIGQGAAQIGGALVGQSMIPIPGVGAAIGGWAANQLFGGQGQPQIPSFEGSGSFVPDYFGGQEGSEWSMANDSGWNPQDYSPQMYRPGFMPANTPVDSSLGANRREFESGSLSGLHGLLNAGRRDTHAPPANSMFARLAAGLPSGPGAMPGDGQPVFTGVRGGAIQRY